MVHFEHHITQISQSENTDYKFSGKPNWPACGDIKYGNELGHFFKKN